MKLLNLRLHKRMIRKKSMHINLPQAKKYFDFNFINVNRKLLNLVFYKIKYLIEFHKSFL
jgi:hypothetical protein